jgi:hypothetical protein
MSIVRKFSVVPQGICFADDLPVADYGKYPVIIPLKRQRCKSARYHGKKEKTTFHGFFS